MKKRLLHIAAVFVIAIFGVVSCSKEQEAVVPVSQETDTAPEGEVTVHFSVTVPRMVADLDTKAESRDSLPQIETMHVAVFGGSGYMKEYRLATLDSKARKNYDGTESTIYNYSVKLSLTNSSIKVHFIGNGPTTPPPFNYEASNIPLLTKSVTDENTDAYWQRILVPDGITAYKYDGISFNPAVHGGTGNIRTGASYTDSNGKIVREGDYINKNGDLSDGTDYMVSEKTTQDLSNVQLIRNFAKVRVTARPKSDSWFELISYTVVNEPTKGTISISPFGGEWLDYLSFNEANYPINVEDGSGGPYKALLNAYPGSLATGTTFDPSVPDPNWVAGSAAASNWKSPSTTPGSPILAGNAPSYIYERPQPENSPTHLIVYGKFYQDGEGNGVPCFYKIDLMDDGKYYTLYRNLQYTITIHKVKKAGKSTADEAEKGSGSGDVSADVDAKSLGEISDGECQLFVSEMAPVLVGQKTNYPIRYKFVYDVTQGDSAVNNKYGTETGAAIKISDAAGVVIASYTVDSTVEDANHYRTVYFNTTAPGTSQKMETITITAEYTGEDDVVHKLYREIVFTLMKQQEMKIQCLPDDIIEGTGTKITARLSIPAGLPQSMFPLQFPIEFVNKTLGPDYDYTSQNLPVQYGQTYEYTESTTNGVTTKPRKDNTSFYFIRTLDWDDYHLYQGGDDGNGAGKQMEIDEYGNQWVYFDSYFKTVEAASATEVYAGCLNSDGSADGTYFSPCKTEITNYTVKDFGWGTDPALLANQDVVFTFTMDPDDYEHEVTVTLTNAQPAELESGLTPVPGEEGKYLVVGAAEVDIKLTLPDEGYTFSIGLDAAHYNHGSKSWTVPVAVSSVTVAPTSVTLNVGQNSNLAATVLPAAAAADNPVTWSSSNTSVVTVTNAGRINAVGAGTATVYASAGGKTGSCTVTVYPTVSLNKSSTSIKPNSTEQLQCTVNNGTGPGFTDATLEWSSSNDAVATVNANGVVSAVARGTAIITVSLKVNGTEVDTAECSVRVANSVTLLINNSTVTNVTNNATYTEDGVTVTIGRVSARNANYIEYNSSSGQEARRRFTVSINQNRTIKKITLTFARKSGTISVTTTPANRGSYTDFVWDAGASDGATSVVFNCTQTGNNNRLTSVEVEYE